MKEKIAVLKRMLDESNYTAALCGSGMLTDGASGELRIQTGPYAIERAYGASPEYIFTSAYYNTRPEQFFHFYKEEVLRYIPDPGLGSYAMAGWSRPESFSASLRRTYLTRLSAAAASM